MMEFVQQVKHATQLRWNRVHKFTAKINLNIQVGPYLIKTAETPSELIESFRLRDEVFNQEFRGLNGFGLDFDKFDYHFDHLIIVHRTSNKIIGTYRLNCSTFSTESYTALEFEISRLKENTAPILELGRACIHKDFRKGSVISLLWRGIAEYMNLCGANILFGCSSIKINRAREAALVYHHLTTQNLVSHDYGCRPTKNFCLTNFDPWHAYFRLELSDTHSQEAEQLIPSLLKSYLKLGAKVAAEPAFDADFDCIDLLTILRREDLAQSLAERLKVIR